MLLHEFSPKIHVRSITVEGILKIKDLAKDYEIRVSKLNISSGVFYVGTPECRFTGNLLLILEEEKKIIVGGLLGLYGVIPKTIFVRTLDFNLNNYFLVKNVDGWKAGDRVAISST